MELKLTDLGRMRGVVTQFDADECAGFLESAGRKFWFSAHTLSPPPRVGEELEFDGLEGLRAGNYVEVMHRRVEA
jgi:hypothetical protein